MVAIRVFVDEGLGHSSYLIDLGDGAAAIVDPPRFPTGHLAAARSIGAALRWTIDTHSHADYVTGSPALVAGHDVTFIAPAASRLETPHHPVGDDEQVTLASGVTLRAIATPGHTPDHHVYVLEDGGTPVALFTGGSLMVAAVGRTDLCGPERAEPLARDMFHSLRRLDTLPDDLPVYPTHGAGSFCSAPGGGDRTSTLGRERATNTLFRIDDEDTFVERLLAGFGTFPTYFAGLPELNRRGPRLFARQPRLERLDVDTVQRHLAGGAVLVDTRPITEFAARLIRVERNRDRHPTAAIDAHGDTEMTDRTVIGRVCRGELHQQNPMPIRNRTRRQSGQWVGAAGSSPARPTAALGSTISSTKRRLLGHSSPINRSAARRTAPASDTVS
jgi:glyoxylase-like metal-dependent hydrolase (beta-lactamase superfamily II)